MDSVSEYLFKEWKQSCGTRGALEYVNLESG